MILLIIFTVLVFVPCENIYAEVIGESVKKRFRNDDTSVDCPGGILLAPTICIPYGYRKGELPKIPLEINTAIEVNNIREIDDKKMTVSLEFHP